jgi:hypothetical protein
MPDADLGDEGNSFAEDEVGDEDDHRYRRERDEQQASLDQLLAHQRGGFRGSGGLGFRRVRVLAFGLWLLTFDLIGFS